ncbi:hypothetical protein TTRE_0000080201 [Trichuris trichiura]|uniref:Uncharacterized protein n=1 Tax=Trichuris trichiura TaxID=36087 RepID=A0A077Z1U4_TRITR|nr:hypothetical protein TTRE_0000080201 [Trichuris trichiura]
MRSMVTMMIKKDQNRGTYTRVRVHTHTHRYTRTRVAWPALGLKMETTQWATSKKTTKLAQFNLPTTPLTSRTRK